jgi:hypothetical protein
MRTKLGLPIVVCYIAMMTSCDPSGNIILRNGYPFAVKMETLYDYRGERLENTIIFEEGLGFAPAAMGHEEYSHIVGIRLFTVNGVFLAEYSREHIERIRQAYQEQINRSEVWIFTDKGLFLEILEIDRKYKFDTKRILEYYRSDEAIRDLDAVLNETRK